MKLSEKELELLTYATEYLLGAEELSDKNKWTQGDINILNDLWLKLLHCKDVMIINSLPKNKSNFKCGYKYQCISKVYDNSLKYNICKINNIKCEYLFPI